jgi:hypothetical protein
MHLHDLVERVGEMPTGLTPLADLGKTKHRRTPKLCSVEILMNNRITPSVQFVKHVPAGSVAGMMSIDLCPEVDTKPSKVRADAAWLSIAIIQLPVQRELGSQNRLQCCWRQRVHQLIDALGMEVTTVSLELRSEENAIGPIDLLSCKSSTPSSTSNGRMSPSHFVELIRSGRCPLAIRT